MATFYGQFDSIQARHKLQVDGTTLLTGATTITGALTQTGAVAMASTLSVAGAVTFASTLDVAGVMSVTGAGKIDIGTTGTPLVLTAGAPLVDIYSTCASTSASASAQPFYMKSTMTGIGGVGGRAQFHMYTNVALGDWSNALKAYAEYGAAGRTTGMGSALCAELLLTAGTTSGNYAPIESEVVINTNGSTGAASGFIYANVDGTAEATFNTNGYLFILGDGIVDTANGLFDVVSVASVAATAALRIKTAAGDYFIPLHTSSAFA